MKNEKTLYIKFNDRKNTIINMECIKGMMSCPGAKEPDKETGKIIKIYLLILQNTDKDFELYYDNRELLLKDSKKIKVLLGNYFPFDLSVFLPWRKDWIRNIENPKYNIKNINEKDLIKYDDDKEVYLWIDSKPTIIEDNNFNINDYIKSENIEYIILKK